MNFDLAKIFCRLNTAETLAWEKANPDKTVPNFNVVGWGPVDANATIGGSPRLGSLLSPGEVTRLIEEAIGS